MTDDREAGLPKEDDERRANHARPSGPLDADADTIAISGGSGPSPSRRDSLSPGQSIGPYRIERLLGSGGMGEVYAAEHVESGHRLAVKVLPSSESWSPELRARFAREGRLAGTINHPNSLYVYGTAEVDGVPLIAMELAPGGTLLDLVESKGPMPVRAAVDAALQIIAGLQAASDAGILHRDVKPANCFVDRNGHVKIGDYGLSLPTASATDSRLTTVGTIMATPAFAPPEQLRGEDVDERADLYAVGATLYFLLTGRLPLEASGAVEMIAAVLQRQPESPHKLRPEIPVGLAAVVLRCLRKEPGERYPTYPELRQALAPFSSAVPLLAPVGIRCAAGTFDWLLLGLITAVVAFFIETGVSPRQDNIKGLLAFVALGLAYTIPEALWGRSPGKALTGLRVVRHSGERADYRNVLLRTVSYLGPAVLLDTVALFLPHESMGQGILGGAFIFSPVLLFLPWHRAARQLGWHDRVTRSLVVRAGIEAGELQRRPTPTAVEELEFAYTVGPYSVHSDPAGARPGQVLEAMDRTLRRRVWILIQPSDEPHVPAARREVSRETRLRWLHGRRSAGLSWDAFEAPDGHPLFVARATAVPWVAVRRWLMELAGETQQILDEGGDVGVLAPERVWVTTGGKVVLLEFVPPGVEHPEPDRAVDPSARHDKLSLAQAFLSRVARRALLGAGDPKPGSAHAAELPLPLHLSRILTRLSEGRYESCASLLDDLRRSVHRPKRISGRRRLLQFAAPTLLFLLLLLPPILIMLFSRQAIERQLPGYRQAVYCLSELGRLKRRSSPDVELRRHDLELYLAGPLMNVLRDSAEVIMIRGVSVQLFSTLERSRIRHAIQSSTSAMPLAIREASERVHPTLTEARLRRRELEQAASVSTLPLLIPCVVAPLLVMIGIAFRGGALLRLFGVAVVTGEGREASRGRILVRSIITWSPLLLVWLVALYMMLAQGPVPSSEAARPSVGLARSAVQGMGDWGYYFGRALRFTLAIPIALFAVGAVYAIARPQRAIQDRLAGTHLVPR